MYSRFRNSELFSSGTNSSFVFENIATKNDGAFLDILTCFYFQYAHSNTQYFYICICRVCGVNAGGRIVIVIKSVTFCNAVIQHVPEMP